jgi:tetratricopeptide (TPR) repeat protein
MSSLDPSLDPLLASAVAAASAGDLPTAIARFAEAADQLTPTRPADAALALESLVRLHLIQGDAAAARAALSRIVALAPDSPRLPRLRAELVDVTGEPADRRAAWRDVAEQAEAPRERSHAHGQIAMIARATGDLPGAIAALEAALATLDDDAGPLARGELLLELSITYVTGHQFDAARAAADQAEAAATAAAVDDGLRLRVTGQRGVIALAAGDATAALTYAEATRAGAVATRDVTTYLAAASLIAMIHEQAGRLVDAYDTYMRAKASLGELLGAEAQGLITPAIALFEERLGPARFREVWDGWVAARRAAPHRA